MTLVCKKCQLRNFTKDEICRYCQSKKFIYRYLGNLTISGTFEKLFYGNNPYHIFIFLFLSVIFNFSPYGFMFLFLGISYTDYFKRLYMKHFPGLLTTVTRFYIAAYFFLILRIWYYQGLISSIVVTGFFYYAVYFRAFIWQKERKIRGITSVEDIEEALKEKSQFVTFIIHSDTETGKERTSDIYIFNNEDKGFFSVGNLRIVYGIAYSLYLVLLYIVDILLGSDFTDRSEINKLVSINLAGGKDVTKEIKIAFNINHALEYFLKDQDDDFEWSEYDLFLHFDDLNLTAIEEEMFEEEPSIIYQYAEPFLLLFYPFIPICVLYLFSYKNYVYRIYTQGNVTFYSLNDI